MKLSKMPKGELEQMSYTDMTYELLKETKKPMTTPDIFKKICKLLDYSEDDYQAKIGDYYTSLTIDKRFVLLDNGKWDVRDNHAIELSVDEEDEEEIIEEKDDEEIVEEKEEDIDDIDDTNDLDVDDDLEELAIIKDEDLDDETE